MSVENLVQFQAGGGWIVKEKKEMENKKNDKIIYYKII